MTAPRSIVIHGHFYQPPREDPWLDEVEADPGAAPAHDWNERIEQECYRAVGAARLPGAGGRIARIVNLYEWMSFNVGPTLLEWLEHAAPDTYQLFLQADRASAARLGHGNAVAMPYHHAILPLSSRREKVTEVRWGIADFRRRFGRDPEGMWLPETAVDEETLDVLAQAGIRFTILAPTQVDPVPPAGRPALVRTLGGRSITVFVYDGAISHDVAFGPLVCDGVAWGTRMLERHADAAGPVLVSAATDGETFGHHHAFGEMALAMMLERMREFPGVTVENYASYLARHGVAHETRLVAPSAWSCSHGVERWRSDCGCKMSHDPPTQQRWRAPLREAMGWLTEATHRIYDHEAPALFADPAAALAGYGEVIGQGPAATHAYALAAARPSLGPEQLRRAAELLELERGALRSLTSCAWFFDDIGGVEALQVLRYAARVVALAGPDAAALEDGLTTRLAAAESNARTLGSGREIYLQRARPHLEPALRIAAGLAAARALAPGAATSPAWELSGPDGDLTLTDRRSGRSTRVAVALERDGLELRATVRALPDGPAITLALADLPERQRTAIAAAIRGGELRRLLTDEEQARLALGEELRPLVRRALLRRVEGLAEDRSPAALGAVTELLVLLEQLGQAVPFDVQTAFYRVWQAQAADEGAMARLAHRMGFVTG